MKSQENLISAWAFLFGVVVAIILGIFQATINPSNGWVYVLLAVLGAIIGMATSREDYRDSVTFLLATISLVIVSYMGQATLALVGNIGSLIAVVLNALLIMFIPATIIVALKTVFAISTSK